MTGLILCAFQNLCALVSSFQQNLVEQCSAMHAMYGGRFTSLCYLHPKHEGCRHHFALMSRYELYVTGKKVMYNRPQGKEV